MKQILLSLLFVLALGCHPCAPSPSSGGDAASDSAPEASTPGTVVTVENATKASTTVYVTFGSDSKVLPSSWSFCRPGSTTFQCVFSLDAKTLRLLPTGGSYLNVTVSFGAAATCGNTKAEVNANNPSWYDVTDVSLVDGFSNFIVVDANGTKIVPHGKSGNEKAFGVYPLGCDGCAMRIAPPCGFAPGTRDGCKGGTQYKPDVPCQYQGPVKGGGGSILVSLVQPEPA